MKLSVDAYKAFCEHEQSIPLFSQAWWLDATAGEGNWDVALVTSDGKIVASLPYFNRNRFGFTFISQPALTQTLGPWLRTSETKGAKRLSMEKDWMNELMDRLPKFHHYSQSWNITQTNWLPFFWRGFKQTTRYTYLIAELNDEKKVWTGIQSNIKTDIKKASSRFNIQVRSDLGIEDFIKLNRLVFKRQGISPPYSDEYVRRIDQACATRGARRIFIAEDDQGRHHSGVYIVWDANSAYYLMGGGDPALRNSGATSLCMWEAIKFAATVTKRFDFEGSMIEPVERFFRSFGAIQTPYFSVSKTTSRILKTAIFLKDLKVRQ